MAQLFSLSFILVAPFWLLMMLAPAWRWTHRIVGSAWIAAPAAALYLLLVIPEIGSVLPAVLNPDLHGIRQLLITEAGVTNAWVHFLAFDLFVGRWIYLDSRERRLNPILMAPILFFTLMLGPIGFLAYMVLRTAAQRSPAPVATT
jgi:hypothetical protein